MRAAHDNCGVKPEDVDYICAHGTGTATGDLVRTSHGRGLGVLTGTRPLFVVSLRQDARNIVPWVGLIERVGVDEHHRRAVALHLVPDVDPVAAAERHQGLT